MPKAPRHLSTEFIAKLTARRRANRSTQRFSVPPERVERYARWWEWRIMGLSVPQIVKQEQAKFSAEEIKRGLDSYADLAMDAGGRAFRLKLHIAFAEACKAKCVEEAQKLERMVKSTGKGIPVETVTYDPLGNVIERKIKYENPGPSMRSWLDSSLKWDQYAASLEGLLRAQEAKLEEIEAIDVDFSGILTLEAPSLESNSDSAEKNGSPH